MRRRKFIVFPSLYGCRTWIVIGAFILAAINIRLSLILSSSSITPHEASKYHHSLNDIPRYLPGSKTHRIETEEQDLLNSLSYYVQGEWISCARNDTLLVESKRTSRRDELFRIEGIIDQNRSSKCKGWENELLRFVPKRLVPFNHNESDPVSEKYLVHSDYRHFSPQQAAACLRNQRILFLGDSHMRNTWRGVLDVLTGTLDDSYERWDGYYRGSTRIWPLNSTAANLLPPSLLPRNNDHSRIGVSQSCQFRNRTIHGHASVLEKAEWSDLWECMGRNELNRVRKQFDLREMDYIPNIIQNNITIHASWCAGSFREGLDTNPNVQNYCTDASFFPSRSIGENTSHLEQLLTSHHYDLVLVGFHNHDIKREHCKNAKDEMVCRERLVEDLYRNTQKFAAFARAKRIPIVWMTVSFHYFYQCWFELAYISPGMCRVAL